MAKANKKTTSAVTKVDKPKIQRKGIHSKKKSSKLKTSKNYKKRYRGQGR
jgi:hypothetical protein